MAQRSGSSQYMRLAEHLTRQLRDGVYQPGDLLPSEAELCEQFEISRITARGALKELEIRGLVSRRPGIGTRALPQPTGRPIFAHAGGSVDDVLQFTRGVPFRLLSRSEMAVTAAQAQELDLPVGQRVTVLHALRHLADGTALASSLHYVPTLLAPSSERLARLQASLAQDIADEQGDEIQSIRQRISACLLDGDAAAALGQEAQSAAVISRRWYMGRDDRLLLLSVSTFPASLYYFESLLVRNAGPTAGPLT